MLSLREVQVQECPLWSPSLLIKTILYLHEEQARNGPYRNNILIMYHHSEPPRGTGPEWPVPKQSSLYRLSNYITGWRRLGRTLPEASKYIENAILTLVEALGRKLPLGNYYS